MNEPRTDLAPGPETSVPLRTAPCRNLRHKGMYVFTEGSPDDHDDEGTIYWCIRTMKGYGPDDEAVDRTECCRGDRTCYEA